MSVLTDEMKQVVEVQKIGYVATVCADGTPNVSPKATFVIVFFMHLGFDSRFFSLILACSILFLAIFFVFATLLNREYWKDVH